MIMPLIYFILGIVFIRYICPMLDQFISWLQTSVEHRRMLLTVKNVKLEKRIDEIVNEDKVPKARQIGFVVDNPEEYETVEEYEVTEEDYDD